MPGRRVAVIEDNDIVREGTALLLRKEGFRVEAFPEAGAALDRLREGPAPALILLDMMLPQPGMDGWGFLQERSRVTGLATVPVVITTGLGVASPEWALSLGASGLLRKPVEFAALLAEVRRCCAEGTNASPPQ